ncbi:suppressor APC domain-containing protein 2-like isoform X1 [Mustelus asterias]
MENADQSQPQPRCLPRTFLLSLRTLFDILDQEGLGSVELREIESRWPGEGSRQPALPPGLLPCLRRAAAPGGRLTFPRLLAGIRTALREDSPGEGLQVRAENRDTAAGETGKSARDHRTWSGDHEGTGIGRSQSIATSIAQGTLYRSCQGRSDPRRHTIANGIDYDMLKQMKELERQRDALLHGLEVVERARDWYHQQIHAVHQRQSHVRQGFRGQDYLTDPLQNRAFLLLAKIQEVNCCLSDLISSSGKLPFPHHRHHVNGFGSPLKVMGFQRQPISSLKEQNHLLTKELSLKSERITLLEQEKASLIKQLMEAQEQGRQNASSEDSSVI